MYARVANAVTEKVITEVGLVLEETRSQNLSSEQVQRLQSVQTFALLSQQKLGRQTAPQHHKVDPQTLDGLPGSTPAPQRITRAAWPFTAPPRGVPVPPEQNKKSATMAARPQRAQSNPARVTPTVKRGRSADPGPGTAAPRGGRPTNPKLFEPATVSHGQQRPSKAVPAGAICAPQGGRGAACTPQGKRSSSQSSSRASSVSRVAYSSAAASADKLNGRPRASSAGASRAVKFGGIALLPIESRRLATLDARASSQCVVNGYY